jgi:hypothetical protein
MQLIQMLDDSILSLPGYLIDANKRIFSIYLISAVLLAIPTYLMQKKTNQCWPLFRLFVQQKSMAAPFG